MKNNNEFAITLNELFVQQQINQDKLLQKGMYDECKKPETTATPVDDIGIMSYQVQQLMSEIGEVLDADKRWKNFRNGKYDEANKKEEIADCFIVLMNMAMYSGMTGHELANTIKKKLDKVSERIEEL